MDKLSAYNSFFTEIINTINSARYQAFKSLNKFHTLSEQANEALKSEYNLDFLGITKPVLEKELENRLIGNIRAMRNAGEIGGLNDGTRNEP